MDFSFSPVPQDLQARTRRFIYDGPSEVHRGSIGNRIARGRTS